MRLSSSFAISFSVLLIAAGAQAHQVVNEGPISEGMQTVLTAFDSLGTQPLEKLSVAEARKQATLNDAAKKVMIDSGLSLAPESVARVQDVVLNLSTAQVPARIYWPRGDGPYPVTLYFHGGGWVIGNKDDCDPAVRALVNRTRSIFISVDYRQAPEHPFPAAHEDAYAAYAWAVANAASVGGDPKRVAVAGESSGGNLAIAVSMMARDRGLQMPIYELSIYPIAGINLSTPSYDDNANTKPLTRSAMNWFFKHYIPKNSRRRDPRIDLVNANLAGLPPTTIITAQSDPLRSEGGDLGDALVRSGNQLRFMNFTGVTHGFFGLHSVLHEAGQAEAFAAVGLLSSF